MKITVDLPENELAEVCEITGINKTRPAIRKLLADRLQTQRRARIAGKFLTGQWSADLKDFEASKALDRSRSKTLSEQWRD